MEREYSRNGQLENGVNIKWRPLRIDVSSLDLE